MSKRHRPDDLESWRTAERADAVHAKLSAFKEKQKRALLALRDFAIGRDCYAGVSWGKDSTVLAHLVARLKADHGVTVPLVWVRVEPVANPDCERVRDAFREWNRDVPYREIEIHCDKADGRYVGTGRLESGFAEARILYGDRHVSGIRADESTDRLRRAMAWGESSPNTCAPLVWWTAADVFAYLHIHGLPVHPAYAQSQGGLWQRDKIRVASLGGQRGTGNGRREWEWHYYRDEMIRLGERP